jgi:archaeosine-15-forming tRNA-guanine transglycosylase
LHSANAKYVYIRFGGRAATLRNADGVFILTCRR